MDRLFLDANILFSAAYQSNAGLTALWRLKNVLLCTSRYALEEARVNLESERGLERLRRLSEELQFFDALSGSLPHGIFLPEKDVPILLSAIEAQANYLLTGDIRHFGKYFGQKFHNVVILSPGQYLNSRRGE